MTEKDRKHFSDPVEAAKWLLGKVICRKLPDGEIVRLYITETEAYYYEDEACYGHGGKITKDNKPLFGKCGTGCAFGTMFLIVCGAEGVSDNEFDPNGAVSRAMLVTVLYRMEKELQAQASPFSDIAGGSYYEKAVAWANANGIVKGVSDAEFAPDESITREQMAAMIYRYAAYKKMDLSAGESTNILSYADYSDISDYAVSAMRYAAGSGSVHEGL